MPNMGSWYLVNNWLIIIVKKKNNAEIDSNEVKTNGMSIESRNVDRLGAIESIKVDIVISKFKTSILFNFYLNIVIISKVIIYWP